MLPAPISSQQSRLLVDFFEPEDAYLLAARHRIGRFRTEIVQVLGAATNPELQGLGRPLLQVADSATTIYTQGLEHLHKLYNDPVLKSKVPPNAEQAVIDGLRAKFCMDAPSVMCRALLLAQCKAAKLQHLADTIKPSVWNDPKQAQIVTQVLSVCSSFLCDMLVCYPKMSASVQVMGEQPENKQAVHPLLTHAAAFLAGKYLS